ncbi:hypothetical protein [Wolbachia endosymbiont (group B) of Hofmannophila pseudospretella]|uniref:hypothetical protein n=1 Tax=Wolbachia endosymbiont (group B) of Hofmannophila pseudospretella TaxID=3066177 RepID=UPI003341FACE
MPFIPLYFIYFSITSFPLLSICSLYSGNWYYQYNKVVLRFIYLLIYLIKYRQA